MPRPASSSSATDPAPGRPLRAFVLAVGVALASGVALAAWSATSGLAAPDAGVRVPRGPLLDRMLDQAQASPSQRAQAHQIFDAADADLRQQRGADRADRAQLAQLFAQPTLSAAAVEAVRGRIEQRHDLESRRAAQALIDVGMVLTPQQRQAISSQLAGGSRSFGAFSQPHAALAAND